MGDPLSTEEEEEVQVTVGMSTRLYSRIKMYKKSNGFPSISETIVYLAQKGIKEKISERESELIQFTDEVTYAKVGNIIEQFNYVFRYYKEEIDGKVELPKVKIDASFSSIDEKVGVRADKSFVGMMRNHADGVTNGSLSKMFRIAIIRGMSLELADDGEKDREVMDKHISIQTSVENIIREIENTLSMFFIDHRERTVATMERRPYDSAIFREKYDSFLDTEAYSYLKGTVREGLMDSVEETIEQVDYSGFYDSGDGEEEVSDE